MAESILMPRQGNTVESCLILSWKKAEGETVAEGEILCEVETDKATFEVESTVSGTVLAHFFAEGDDVPVLTPIAAVGEPGEDVSGLRPDASSSSGDTPPTAPTPSLPATSSVETPAVDTNGGRVAVSPRARRLAERSGVDPALLSGRGTGPRGRIIERDVALAIASGEPLTPAAIERRKAGDTAPAVGTGIGGRVLASDMESGVAVDAEPGAGIPATFANEYPGVVHDQKLSNVRKIIAERMHASLRDTAQLTLHTSADARSILRYRKLLKQSDVDLGLRSITINDIVLYAAVRAVREFPEMNAHFEGDHIRQFESVHAGFAVDTPRGLMVPVIQFADRLTLRGISHEANRLADACQDGSIKLDELSGGTFTVSNLGALGIEMFTPVLNPPQVGILGVCSIENKPVARAVASAVAGEAGIELVPHLGLSLTIDHRAIDGSPASWFLRRLREAIADFDLMLAG